MSNLAKICPEISISIFFSEDFGVIFKLPLGEFKSTFTLFSFPEFPTPFIVFIPFSCEVTEFSNCSILVLLS